MFHVQLIEKATGKIVEDIPARSRSKAERIERGASINLDRTRFYTVIRED